MQWRKLVNNANRDLGEDVKMLCGPTVAFLYMFHLVVVSTDMGQLTETVEQKPIKMLINNAKKEISIALEGLLLAKMLMRTSDIYDKDRQKIFTTS